MPGYIEKALQRFTHPTPERPQHSPHAWVAPDYGAKVQYYTVPDDSTLALDKHGIKWLQEVIGTFLYSARAVDNTMLVALGTLAAAQTKGTEKTMEAHSGIYGGWRHCHDCYRFHYRVWNSTTCIYLRNSMLISIIFVFFTNFNFIIIIPLTLKFGERGTPPSTKSMSILSKVRNRFHGRVTVESVFIKVSRFSLK
jgi:hypothetical protein